MFYLQSLVIPRKRVRSWVIVPRFHSVAGIHWLRVLGRDRRFVPCSMLHTLSIKAWFPTSLRYESSAIG